MICMSSIYNSCVFWSSSTKIVESFAIPWNCFVLQGLAEHLWSKNPVCKTCLKGVEASQKCHAFWDSTSWQKFVGPCRAVVVRWNAECVTNAVGPFRHVHARLNLLNGRGAQWFKSSISARRDKLDSGIIKRPSDSIVFEETKLQANDDVVKEWEFTLLWSWLMKQVVVLEARQSQIGVAWKFGSAFANLCRSLDFNGSCLHAWIYWVSQMCHEIIVQWRA